MKFSWRRMMLLTAAIVIGVPLALIALYALIPPPLTPLMLLRTWGYDAVPRHPPPHSWDYRWTPLDRISPALVRTVIAAEDSTFCHHHGFDAAAYDRAWETYLRGETVRRGGSTISQQAAKNVFLWPGRTGLRKAIETVLTPALELIWGKRRIMEIYLNVVEWGPGIFGAQAAAQYDFHTTPRALSLHEAALLAAVLPDPRGWPANPAGPYVSWRAGVIEARSADVDASCVLKR
jgi:monofunctional biosynthetic peptidoglycan transglycosylase